MKIRFRLSQTHQNPEELRVTLVHGTAGAGGSVASLRLLLEALEPGPLTCTVITVVDSPSHVAFGPRCHVAAAPSETFRRSVTGLLRLRALVAKTKPDMVIANTMSSLPAVLLTAPTGSRIGVWLRNSEYSRKEAAVLRFAPYFRRGIFAIAPSKFALHLAVTKAAWCRTSGYIIPNPVAPVRLRSGSLGEGLIIGIVTSSHSAVKGADFAADVIGRCDPIFRWRIFGTVIDPLPRTGRIGIAMYAMAQMPNVRLEGKVHFPPADGKLDILLVTSRRESFCRVAAEAMSVGIPIVAPRHTALTELIEQGGAGILFEPENAAAAAEAVMELARDAQLRQALGVQGSAYARARFSPSEVARAFNSLATHI